MPSGWTSCKAYTSLSSELEMLMGPDSPDPETRSGCDGTLGSDLRLGGDVPTNPSGPDKLPILEKSEEKWKVTLKLARQAIF